MNHAELEAREAIKHLKALYCYLLDYKDWPGYAALFTSDATLDVDRGVSTRGRAPDPLPQVRGRDAIERFMPTILSDADTVHQVHSPIIDLALPGEASGIWAMEDIVLKPGFHLEGRGHYRERYAVEEGRWRIASLHLTRTWLRVRHGADAEASFVEQGKGA